MNGMNCRNTPTGVGKTAVCSCCWCPDRKHPHGRGEDLFNWRARLLEQETPPRAWGRLPVSSVSQLAAGNTPTGVGKTAFLVQQGLRKKKHPHGRGEDFELV